MSQKHEACEQSPLKYRTTGKIVNIHVGKLFAHDEEFKAAIARRSPKRLTPRYHQADEIILVPMLCVGMHTGRSAFTIYSDSPVANSVPGFKMHKSNYNIISLNAGNAYG